MRPEDCGFETSLPFTRTHCLKTVGCVLERFDFDWETKVLINECPRSVVHNVVLVPRLETTAARIGVLEQIT